MKIMLRSQTKTEGKGKRACHLKQFVAFLATILLGRCLTVMVDRVRLLIGPV